MQCYVSIIINNELPAVFSTFFSDKIQTLRDTVHWTLCLHSLAPQIHPSPAHHYLLFTLSQKMRFSEL
jgi:hypothetical protein